jgi:hypothetical protein
MTVEEEFELHSRFVRADALEAAYLELQMEEHSEELRLVWREFVLPLLEAEWEKARAEFDAYQINE